MQKGKKWKWQPTIQSNDWKQTVTSSSSSKIYMHILTELQCAEDDKKKREQRFAEILVRSTFSENKIDTRRPLHTN